MRREQKRQLDEEFVRKRKKLSSSTKDTTPSTTSNTNSKWYKGELPVKLALGSIQR